MKDSQPETPPSSKTDTPIFSETDINHGRLLKDKDIRKLRKITIAPVKIDKNKSSLLLAQLLQGEDVNYGQALEIFKNIEADTNILRKTYNDLLQDNEKNTTTTFAEILIKDGVSRTQATKIEHEIIKTIKAPRHYNQIIGVLGDDIQIIADPGNKEVLYENVKTVNDKDYSRQKIVIKAYPSHVIVYDSPIPEEPRKFEIIWESRVKKGAFKTGPDLLEDIQNDLIRDGYVIAKRLVDDVLPALMNTYIESNLAEIKTDIETPGFFKDFSSNKIISVKYDISNPETKDLKQALQIIEKLAEWYPNNEKKLATVLKWGLISPFIYSQKQSGKWTPWLYLYGKAKSGKTTLGQIVLYMWGEPDVQNDLGGSGFDTVARVGGKLAQSTFPIVVNEPGGAFQRVSVTEMIKTAIERTTSRGRYEGRRYVNKPSFNPVIFTANKFMPTDDALIRRLWILNFTHKEKKTETEAFEKEWQTHNHKQCKFNLLKPIAQAASVEYMNDTGLWDLDWQELADTLFTRLYLDTGMNPPEWIYYWSKSETMEDLDDEDREKIRKHIVDEINRAERKIQVVDYETGRPVYFDDDGPDLKRAKDFKERVWRVINEGLISWIEPIEQKGKKYVCLTIGFKEEANRVLEISQPLKGIGELMGWEVKPVRLPGNKVQKVIKIKLDDFLQFLHPLRDG